MRWCDALYKGGGDCSLGKALRKGIALSSKISLGKKIPFASTVRQEEEGGIPVCPRGGGASVLEELSHKSLRGNSNFKRL